MSLSSTTLLAKRGISGGEVRRSKVAATEELFEVETKGRLFRASFDPRESGACCFVSLYAWAVPEGERIDAAEHDEILDALWSLLPGAGVRALVVRFVEPECYVAKRWSHPEGYALATVSSSHVEVLLLGKTMRVPYHEKPGSAAEPVAVVEPAGAEWLYPERRPMTDVEWSAIWPKLKALSPKSLFFCDYEWRFEK